MKAFLLSIGILLISSTYAANLEISDTQKHPSNQEFISELIKDIENLNTSQVKFALDSLKIRSLKKEEYLELIARASTRMTPQCYLIGLISSMDRAFPEYKISDHIFDSGSIRERGLQIILDSHVPEHHHKNHFSILNSFSALKAKVNEAMKDDGSHGIFFHEGEAAHWSLIYINKNLKKKNCTVQILDAAGDVQAVKISIAVKEVIPVGCKIAIEDDRRQCDTTSCSVFALNDYFNLSALDEVPVDLCQPDDHGHLQSMRVPPQLMALAQSHEVIDRFIASHEQTKSDISDVRKQIESTTVTLPKHSETVGKENAFCAEERDIYFNSEKAKTINIGAKMLYNKYVNQIIHNLISSSKLN